MRIFERLLVIIKYSGFILILFFISAIITSLVYYNHQINTIDQVANLEIYQKEEVANFSSYGDNYLNIEIEFLEEKNDYYVMMYAYYYFDNYHKPIQLEDYKNSLIITINQEGILTLCTI